MIYNHALTLYTHFTALNVLLIFY